MTDAMISLKKANPDKYFIPGSTDPYWIPKSIDYFGDTNYLGVLTDRHTAQQLKIIMSLIILKTSWNM